MENLSTFFDDSDSTLGAFHPTDYIVARFPTENAAFEAHKSLLNVGIPPEEMYVAPPAEVVEYFKNFRDEAGLLGSLIRPLSRFIGTEVKNADDDLQKAVEGAGFIAMRCADEERALRVIEAIKRYEPGTVDWYLWGGVRSMINQ